jgi:DNA primase
VVPLPPGSDPAELVQTQGAKEALRLIDDSMPFVSFQVRLALEQGDLSSAEGKDRVIDALRPAFATLPPSALREELVGTVAEAAGLAHSLVSSWLPVAGEAGREAAAPAIARPAAAENGRSAVIADPIRRDEYKFLAACMAEPVTGAKALAQVTDDEFGSELTRRVAAHLRDHLKAPGSGLPEGDDELVRLIARLSQAAAEMDRSSDAVEAQLRELWIAREEHLVDMDLREGSAVAERVARIGEWKRERAEFLGRAIEASRPQDA